MRCCWRRNLSQLGLKNLDTLELRNPLVLALSIGESQPFFIRTIVDLTGTAERYETELEGGE